MIKGFIYDSRNRPICCFSHVFSSRKALISIGKWNVCGRRIDRQAEPEVIYYNTGQVVVKTSKDRMTDA